MKINTARPHARDTPNCLRNRKLYYHGLIYETLLLLQSFVIYRPSPIRSSKKSEVLWLYHLQWVCIHTTLKILGNRTTGYSCLHSLICITLYPLGILFDSLCRSPFVGVISGFPIKDHTQSLKKWMYKYRQV